MTANTELGGQGRSTLFELEPAELEDVVDKLFRSTDRGAFEVLHQVHRFMSTGDVPAEYVHSEVDGQLPFDFDQAA